MEYAKKVREKSSAILKEHGMELPPPMTMHMTRKVWCYPVQFAIGCPKLPVVEYLPDRDQALLRYQGDTLVINSTHLQKLVSLILWNKELLLYCSRFIFFIFFIEVFCVIVALLNFQTNRC